MLTSPRILYLFFFFNDTATTEIYTLSLHDALPISPRRSSTVECTYVSAVVCTDEWVSRRLSTSSGTPAPARQRRVGMAKLVRREVEPHPPARAPHNLHHVRVAHRPANTPAPQVHEHVVTVERPVLLVHVVRVQPHELAADRHRARAALAARAVGVIHARHHLDPPLVADDVLVAQTERLANPHPGPEKQRKQEPVPQPPLAPDHRRHLLERQRPRQPPLLPQPAHPAARLRASDPVQERLVAAPPRPAGVHQRPRDVDPVTGEEFVEAKQRRQHRSEEHTSELQS